MPLLSFVLNKQYSAAAIRMSVDFMFHYNSQTCIKRSPDDRLIQVDILIEVWKT